jgi:hypothetical protein
VTIGIPHSLSFADFQFTIGPLHLQGGWPRLKQEQAKIQSCKERDSGTKIFEKLSNQGEIKTKL